MSHAASEQRAGTTVGRDGHGRASRTAPGLGRPRPLGRAARRADAVALVVVAWLLVKAAEDPRKFAVVTLNGLTLAALYFVVASGFTLIFGLMRVVNMAHGSLYLLGGYLALQMQERGSRRTPASACR